MTGWTRVWQRAAIALGGLCLLLTLGYKLYAPEPGSVWGHYFWTVGVVLPLYLVAVWLVRLRPDHPQAQRMLLAALGSCGGVAVESLARAVYVDGGPDDWLWALNLVHQMTGVLSTAAGGVLIASYPDGRVERAWQRLVVRLSWWQLAIPPLVLVTQPEPWVSPYLFDFPGPNGVRVSNPFAVSWLSPVGGLMELVLIGSVGAFLGLAVLVARYALADEERRRMRPLIGWVVLTVPLALAFVVMDLLGVPSDSVWYQALGFLFIPIALMIPVSIVIGVLRHQLFDIEVAVRGSFVYGAWVVCIALVYVALAAAPGLALGDAMPVEIAVLLTVVVAVLIQPARRRLEAVADRWVFGERVNRYQLVTAFGAGLERTVDLDELLPRLAETVRLGLGAAWVRVALRGEEPGAWLAEPVGMAGDATGEAALVEELRHDGELVGRLECGQRDGGYDDADRQLVATLARQAATAIANVRLAAHLQEQVAELARSRARIVAAQDDERRRIERDIHDGVQQQVVALIAKLRLARNQLGRGEEPGAVLAELQSDAGELLVDLRELAHGIHPPVLSDGGLVAAVEARAARLPMAVEVRADDALRGRRFDADVEAAAYFVVCEALTNVVKHAEARAAQVDLAALNGHLSLSVSDDGNGGEVAAKNGHGLTNLRDRVEALGGRLRVQSLAGEGTSVSAELPVGAGRG